ncbi:alpha/beta hydrolase [Actinomyces gaoshouyii]|uniref:Alpha/beta hydrolase n=1 Tax=Actinomyces gaoshouyii TaxID=1960083 RepID=A0A8H9LHY2_9ACTO|nr:alpha/beta hydrolase [Actinomyces gaoshouyii]GGO95491.1 alpha/beta hydrolase [Actinomyces gaoshouyii]
MSTLDASSRPRRIKILAALSALTAAAALSACGNPSVPGATRATGAAAASVPAGLESFYNQSVEWYPCKKDAGMTERSGDMGPGTMSCARVTVPLDYNNPGGETIQIAMKKRSASADAATGTLFINPGGPGGSGVDILPQVTSIQFSKDVVTAYDVIGFDPRGVGASTAIDCLTDAELDAERSGTESSSLPDDATGEQKRAAVAEETAEREAKCRARTRPVALLDHVDTVSAAKDLDILRAVTGNSALTYFGYSYGTFLGATYADLFPGNVGRFVLDGAVDPAIGGGRMALGQAKGFESALRAYVESCQSGSDCPLTGSVDDGIKQIQDFLASLKAAPIGTSDEKRPLTRSLAISGIMVPLYQSEVWPQLSIALSRAMGKTTDDGQPDGAMLLYFADAAAQRGNDGTYSGNGDEAISAINCADFPVSGDAASWDEEAAEIKEASPTFGDSLQYTDVSCRAWGHSSGNERKAIHASGANPILVIGTTGDPATPYEWSQSLADQLDSGQLLTWKGNGHTAYGRAGTCVTTAVDDYLLKGTMPAEGLTCEG